MRPMAWVSLVFLCGVMSGLCSYGSSLPRPPRTAKSDFKKNDPVWIVQSAWMANRREALEDALEKAQGEVVKYLRSQQPALIWTPSKDYIQDALMRDMPHDESGFQDGIADTVQSYVRAGRHDVQEEERNFDRLGAMHRVCIKVAITPQDYEGLYREDAQYRARLRQELAQQRQSWLARGLTIFVALLTAIAGYFRLEDITKGYYTHWLRLAAVMLVALVGAGVWVLW